LLTEYKILLEKWIFSSGTPLSEINFFSGQNKELVKTIDLKPYIMDIGPINNSFEKSSKSETYYSTFPICSNISFTLKGIKNQDYLKSFFGITQNTWFYQYIVNIANNNGKSIWKGIIYQETIEEEFHPSEDSEVIKITAISLTKEFKEYYKTKYLSPWDSIDGWQKESNLKDFSFNSINISYYKIPVSLLLSNMFNNSLFRIEMQADLSQFFVINFPYFGHKKSGSELSNNEIFLKMGYHRIYDSYENKFDFLLKLCNAMGWIFFFEHNILYIKDKCYFNPQQYTIYSPQIEKYTLKKQKEEISFKNIIFLDGKIFAGKYTGCGGMYQGERFYGKTCKNYSLNNKPWSRLSQGHSLKFDVGYRWQRYEFESNDTWSYRLFEWIPQGHGSELYHLSKEETLFLNVGDIGNLYWGYSTNDGHQFFTSNPSGMQEDELCYNGNYGNVLFRYNSNYLYTYIDYAKSLQFSRNMDQYYQSFPARSLSLTLNKIIESPFISIRIIGIPDILGDWAIKEIKTDLLKNKTQLELTKIN